VAVAATVADSADEVVMEADAADVTSFAADACLRTIYSPSSFTASFAVTTPSSFRS
jgi:hypothetical protein